MKRTQLIAGMLIAVTAALTVGCKQPKVDPVWRREKESELTINRFKTADPSMARFFNGSAGYVVFPNVTKAGVGFGGAFGKGVVYQGQEVIGTSILSEGNVGIQLGGQSYSQIIFFQWPEELEVFKQGQWQTAVTASAVLVRVGAAANVDYSNGVAVFIVGQEGLMGEASIGGQHFSFSPK